MGGDAPPVRSVREGLVVEEEVLVEGAEGSLGWAMAISSTHRLGLGLKVTSASGPS